MNISKKKSEIGPNSKPIIFVPREKIDHTTYTVLLNDYIMTNKYVHLPVGQFKLKSAAI